MKKNLMCQDELLDNVFIPKTPEKQCTEDKAIKEDIDEWIY
jgi:hypothetical protein